MTATSDGRSRDYALADSVDAYVERSNHLQLSTHRTTDFERREIAALGAELDKEYPAHIGLAHDASEAKPTSQVSSRSRT